MNDVKFPRNNNLFLADDDTSLDGDDVLREHFVPETRAGKEGAFVHFNTNTANFDAFARFRVSNPETLFDSKNIFDDPDQANASEENQPLFYDNQEVTGSGTGTKYNPTGSSQEISVGAVAGNRTRQTKMRFNYQPGKSQLTIMTFNFRGHDAGVVKREGLFDDSDGVYLELDGLNTNIVLRSSSAADQTAPQADWSFDTMNGTGESGILLDFTKTQIFFIDFEWLGVGRVRCGFFVNGIPYYVHDFSNANVLDVVYMQTPNLPLRSEIESDGTGVASTMDQICSTVISEGGSQDLGIDRWASTDGNEIICTSENIIYALMGIRLKSNYIGASIKILNASIQIQSPSEQIEYFFRINPNVAGTFAYADEINSAVQIARGASANTITNGVNVGNAGHAESGGNQAGNAGSSSVSVTNALRVGSAIDGTVDTLVLCARPVGGSSNVNVEAILNWRELV